MKTIYPIILLPALVFSLLIGPHAGAAESTRATAAAKEQGTGTAKPSTPAGTKAPTVAAPEPSRKILVFRNVRSWKRKVDFEEALDNLGFKYDVRPSAEMETTDLSPYGCVIIPGAQWRTDFYRDYAEQEERFDRYVTNGGTLLLELNGAEDYGIMLPRGVTMVKHGSIDNAIIQTNHPILLHRAGQPIHANYAGHGYLEGVPKDAIVLVTEQEGDEAIKEKPTFVEYPYGKGRVIAACQCFHDQDGSGRGALMDASISYAAERIWYSPRASTQPR